MLAHSRLHMDNATRLVVCHLELQVVLRQLQVEPRLLLVHRDPASNIRSFSRKGKVPPLWAEALWQRTYEQALLAIRSLPEECWAITRFEDLLQQPQATVLEICAWLQHPVNAKQRDQLGRGLQVDAAQLEVRQLGQARDARRHLVHAAVGGGLRDEELLHACALAEALGERLERLAVAHVDELEM